MNFKYFDIHIEMGLTTSQFAQELLSTFSTDLGEVALVPMTGGVFTVTIRHHAIVDGQASTQESILWDRKRDGGFPGTSCLMILIFAIVIYPFDYWCGFYAYFPRLC